MTNLIFDLSNIAFRSMYIVSGYSNKMTFDSQSEVDQLVRKIAMDVSFITRLVNPSRVILALDAKSWRKDIKIEENEGYKSGRVKSKAVNWDNVYKALDDFTSIMETQGMIVTRIENAEGDDIMALWADELLYKQEQHVIIVSGDEDVRQLVQTYPSTSGKNVYSTVFNPFMQGKNATRKLYIPKYFEEWINTTDVADIFNMKGSIDVDKEDFKKIITTEKCKMEYTDGRMIALRKIFCGDDGDNVPAFFSWLIRDVDGTVLKDKNGENRKDRITNGKFEKIYESLLKTPNEEITYYEVCERQSQLKELIEKITKQTPPFKIQDRLNRQLKLVVLSPHLFPEQIRNDFEELKEKQLARPRINYSASNMYNLLEGSKYVNVRKGNESTIFSEIDKTIGKSLF